MVLFWRTNMKIFSYFWNSKENNFSMFLLARGRGGRKIGLFADICDSHMIYNNHSGRVLDLKRTIYAILSCSLKSLFDSPKKSVLGSVHFREWTFRPLQPPHPQNGISNISTTYYIKKYFWNLRLKTCLNHYLRLQMKGQFLNSVHWLLAYPYPDIWP